MLKNKIFKNASWIVICKLGQSFLSLLVTMLTARCLGPSNYGLISYVASLVSFVIPIAQLGLGNIEVQELVEHNNDEGGIIGTSLLLSVISSIACYIGIIIFVKISNPNESITLVVSIIYSVLLLFQGATLLGYWFQAKLFSKYSSLVSLVVSAILSIYKVFLLLADKSIYWFAFSNVMEYILTYLFLYIMYKKLNGRKLFYSKEIASRMWSKSKYYILVDIMIIVFSQTDKVMLKMMINDAATGFYAAAFTCSNLFAFVLTAIIDSFRPVIFNSHKTSREAFEHKIILLYSIVTYSSLIMSVGISILAPIIINIIYGVQYESSINVLRILTWYLLFSYVGVIRNIWILAEKYQKWLTPINFAGALLNIVLNVGFIPCFGVCGAALASVLTQFLMNIIATYLLKETRRSIILFFKGLNPKILIDFINNNHSYTN